MPAPIRNAKRDKEIKSLSDKGVSILKIAKIYGISKQRVSKIIQKELSTG